MITLTFSMTASHRSPKAANCGEDFAEAAIRAFMSASSELIRSAQWTTAPRGFLQGSMISKCATDGRVDQPQCVGLKGRMQTLHATPMCRECQTDNHSPYLMTSHINKSLMLPLGLDRLISPLLLQLLRPLQMRNISQRARNRHNAPIIPHLRI
jgi:hypothetical protein